MVFIVTKIFITTLCGACVALVSSARQEFRPWAVYLWPVTSQKHTPPSLLHF